MEAIELRKKTTELEKKVQKLIIEFLDDVGPCEVNINDEQRSTQKMTGEVIRYYGVVKISIII